MSTKVQSTTTEQQTTTPTATAEETEMNRLRLQQFRDIVGPQTAVQQQGLDLISKLFSGSQNLPGFFGEMGLGISPQAIGNQAAELGRQAMPGFQQLGLGDSGVAYSEISKNIANQLLFPAEQFNLGAKQNLLNLALSGQAQVQQPITANTGSLGQQLAGLRSIASSGYSNTVQRNPFLTGADIMGGVGAGIGVFAALCWVAKEIFGSWEHPKTIMARFYISNYAPTWFKNFYIKYGERIADFIHDKPIFKLMLRPLFEVFAIIGRRRQVCLTRY